jgi:GTP-binding protein EngB required for normal cell division
MKRPIAKRALPAEDALNEAQRLRLSVSCQYIDRLLADIGNILHTASSPSPFAKYIVDISPAQARVLEDYIHRLREQLLRSLAWQQLEPGEPSIPATHAILTNLSFIDIAVEELRPRHMRGSGAVSDRIAGELNGVVHELRSLIEGMNRYLRQEMGTNLEARLERLQQQGADVSLLQTTAEIISRHGLVEFRGRLEAITSRLEDSNFEVAFFGRVSSGKSSLLNALLGKDILPVGINPITAVPTRLRSGPNARAVITFVDGHSEKIPLDEIARFVTEQGNPGNTRNVIKAVAEIPSPSLTLGIVLVDTPGLGSLATRGTAETLAYLPSADLGVLLIDAGTTLSEEDIGTLRRLYEAGIPSLVLLSKADLLQPDDLESALAYIREHLQQQLGIKPTVYPVSARPSHSALLDRFYQTVLLPRLGRSTVLRDESASRKIAAFRHAVIASMEAALDRGGLLGNLNRNRLEELEATLRHTMGVIGEQRRVFECDLLRLEEGSDRALSHLAQAGLQWVRNTRQTAIPARQVSEWVATFVEDQLSEPLRRLRETSEQAIHNLQQVAAALNTPDTPAVSEVEMLLRDLPRFEFADLACPGVPWSDSVAARRWIPLGEKVAAARMRSQLRPLEPLLRDQFRAYGRVLHRWMERTTRALERLASSYADGYRVQIQRLAGHTAEPVDLERLRLDLGLLMRSGTKMEGQSSSQTA